MDDAVEMLARARQEVLDLLARRPDGVDQPARGVGTAADGLVRAVAVDGRLERLELDPMVMRMPSQDLAEAFVKAANEAIDATLPSHPADLPEVDLGALAADLERVEEMGIQTLRRCAESVDEALGAGRRWGAR